MDGAKGENRGCVRRNDGARRCYGEQNENGTKALGKRKAAASRNESDAMGAFSRAPAEYIPACSYACFQLSPDGVFDVGAAIRVDEADSLSFHEKPVGWGVLQCTSVDISGSRSADRYKRYRCRALLPEITNCLHLQAAAAASSPLKTCTGTVRCSCTPFAFLKTKSNVSCQS
jgi:hypothetical protein